MAGKANVGAGTPQVNQNPPASSFSQLPVIGRFPVSVLAVEYLKMDPSTLRRWVKKFNCPFKQPGDEMFVDVVDLWNSWPYQSPAETEPRHGGNRRKKAE